MTKYDGSISIKMDVDAKSAEKTLDAIVEDVESIGDGFKDAEKGAGGFADVLKGNLLSGAIVSGIRGLADGVKGLAKNFIESAADVKAETSQFEQAFGSLQDAAGEAIGRVADVSGVLETRLNSLGSQLYSFARSSGGNTTESLDLMEKALQAAADNAAYFDKSIEDSAATLQSFLKGNYENDAALGVASTEFTRNAKAAELFGKQFMELSEIQKQQTLLQMVLDAQEISGALGQAAREADGWENVQGNLNESWRQFMSNAGAPMLASLVPIIQGITDGLSEWTKTADWAGFSESVKGFVDSVIENGPEILSIISGVGAGFVAWNVVTMIQGVIGAVNAFKTANEGLKLSQIALNAVMNANPLALIATLIAGVVAALVVLWNTSEDFRNAVTGIFEKIKAAFLSAWDAIQTKAKNAVSSLKTIFGGLLDFITGVFTGNWRKAFTGLGNVLIGIVNGWITAFENFINFAISGINGLISGANKIVSSIPGVNLSIPLVPEFKLNRIPQLATGAVIPPNREFLAVLGDQRSGNNIEAPESLIRKIVREEAGGMNSQLLQEILQAIKESGTIMMDGQKVSKRVAHHLNNMTAAAGKSVLLL